MSYYSPEGMAKMARGGMEEIGTANERGIPGINLSRTNNVHFPGRRRSLGGGGIREEQFPFWETPEMNFDGVYGPRTTASYSVRRK